jgi:hypothetical protein
MAEVIPEGIRLGIVGGISYGLFGKPDTFMPQLRELGATLRIYICWSQVEPEPGNYTFEMVDAFLDQLDGSRGGLGHPLLQLHVGNPASDQLHRAFAGQGSGRLLRVRVPPGTPLRRPGALLAVRQRAQQCRLDLAGNRAGLRRPAQGDASGGQRR